MPPVEQSSIPHSAAAVKSIELKSVGKARGLPLVSDTIDVASSFASQISENVRVQSARQIVEDSFKTLSENETINNIQGKMKELNEYPRVKQTLSTVKDKMSGAVEGLDSLAVGGIDKVTTALPVLTTPTPELVENTKDVARSYFSLATEYVASFRVSQLSLKLADKSLAIAEKTTKFFKSEKSKEGVIAMTYSKLRKTRRALRAVKRAGERKSYLDKDPVARVGMMGRLASMFSVNSVLGMAGLQIVPEKSVRVNVDNQMDDQDDKHRKIEDLKGDLDGYKSDEDPDYHPDQSEDDSLDSSSSDSGDETDDEMSEDAKDRASRIPLSPASEVLEGRHH